MKLTWERLEEIIVAKARMADDSAKAVIDAIRASSGDVSLDQLVRVRECQARGNTALTILVALREAESLAKSPLDRLVWCCDSCHVVNPATPLQARGDSAECYDCGGLATVLRLSEALASWPEDGTIEIEIVVGGSS